MSHHLHSVIVSYQRLELTQQAIASYFETVTLPFTLIVVDNGSSRSTQRWLKEAEANYQMRVLLFDQNHYPGYACNRGWEQMPSKTTLLHRGDNDFAYLPGWCEHMFSRFTRNVGQVGLRTHEQEDGAISNVGGNNVILRMLWDKGLRYDERPWNEYPPGWTEDTLLSPAVKKMGYRWTRVKQPCVRSLATDDPRDPYYQKSWAARRITPPETI